MTHFFIFRFTKTPIVRSLCSIQIVNKWLFVVFLRRRELVESVAWFFQWGIPHEPEDNIRGVDTLRFPARVEFRDDGGGPFVQIRDFSVRRRYLYFVQAAWTFLALFFCQLWWDIWVLCLIYEKLAISWELLAQFAYSMHVLLLKWAFLETVHLRFLPAWIFIHLSWRINQKIGGLFVWDAMVNFQAHFYKRVACNCCRMQMLGGVWTLQNFHAHFRPFGVIYLWFFDWLLFLFSYRCCYLFLFAIWTGIFMFLVVWRFCFQETAS